MTRAEHDRRVERTRASLKSAFTQLVFARGFETVKVRDVIAAAGVGRSTFYEHFRSKEDILAACMAQFLTEFADAALSDHRPPRLEAALDHLWSNRRLTDAIFTGAAGAVLARTLTAMIEHRLAARGEATVIPPRLIAISICEAQLGLVVAWLRGRAFASPQALSEALHAASRASVEALVHRCGQGTYQGGSCARVGRG